MVVWILQNAELGAHTLICEDGPVLPKEPGPSAEKGGEVLEGTYAQSCTMMEGSEISERSGRAGGQISAAGVPSGPAGIVSKDPRTVPA
jgi:hypothetical protein